MIKQMKKGKRLASIFSAAIFASIILFGAAACKQLQNKEADGVKQGVNDTSSIKPTPTSTSTAKPAVTSKPSQRSTDPYNQLTEVYYGDWTIKRVLAYGNGGTYSEGSAKELLGRSLSFSVDKANYFGEQASAVNKILTKPVYKKSIISNADFISNYRMSFDRLGIRSNSVSEVQVSDSKGNQVRFFIKDINTLIIYGGNTYFELVRK